LSDDLLQVEEETLAAIQGVFAAALPSVGRRVRDDPLAVVDLLRDLLPESAGPVASMLDRAAEMTLRSLDDEMRAIEACFGKRYAGVAETGIDSTEADRQSMTENALEQYAASLLPIVEGFRVGVEEQVAMHDLYDDGDKALLVARFVSPEPLRLMGNSGRGIWWRPMSGAQMAARACSIGLVNALRSATIENVNRASAARS